MEIKDKNMKYAKKKFNHNFIVITYEIITMKWNEQGYGFKIIHQIDVEQTNGNGDLAQESFCRSFHMPTIQGTFWIFKKSISELKMNSKKAISHI